MAEDLGQDIGEYLLSHKRTAWEWLVKAYNYIGKNKTTQTSGKESADEIISLDMQTVDDANKLCEFLNENGIEAVSANASVVCRKADLLAAEDQIKQRIQLEMNKDNQSKVEATQEMPVVDSPITAKQKDYISRLADEGHIPSEKMPENLDSLSSKEADALIKDARKGKVAPLRETAAECREAAEAMAQQRKIEHQKTRPMTTDKAPERVPVKAG